MVFCLLLTKIQAQNTDEDEANAFLEDYNEIYGKLLNNYTIASWNYETNITDENSQIASDSKLQMSKYSAEALEIASQFDSTNFTEDRVSLKGGEKRRERRERRQYCHYSLRQIVNLEFRIVFLSAY